VDAVLWEALEQLSRQLDEAFDDETAQTDLLVGAAEGASIAMVAGFLSWFLRGGTLLTSLLTTLPLWSRLDPVAVLSATGDEEEELEERPDDADSLDDEEAERRANRILEGQQQDPPRSAGA